MGKNPKQRLEESIGSPRLVAAEGSHWPVAGSSTGPGPLTNPRDDKAEAKVIYGYSVGKGHVLHKHRYPRWYVAYLAVRPLARALGWIARLRWSKAAISLAVTKGVIYGYFLSIKLAHVASDITEPLTNSM